MLQGPLLLIFLPLNNIVLAQMEGRVVDGERIDIQKTPHSVFLDISCKTRLYDTWICGASIINQNFALTAAHCVADCKRSGFIAVAVGHENKERGVVSSAYKFKAHENFAEFTMNADLALVMMRTQFKFGPNIKRAILMRHPPKTSLAYISGWGLIDESREITTPWLYRAKQTVLDTSTCNSKLRPMPEGCLCAESIKGYASSGDSGSALVVHGYVQVGVVSYKEPDVSRSLIVYANVSHYYDWILRETKKVYCG